MNKTKIDWATMSWNPIMHRKRRCRRIDAAAIISYLGYLQHSDTYNYYKRHIKPNVSVQYCKRRISALAKKSNKEARKAT